MSRQRVTIVDVARAAGVSAQTVSRVLNNKGEVSQRTREAVLAAIRQLGYRPDGVARSLVTRRTRTIGLVVPDIANPFFPEIARGVEEIAQTRSYRVFLCNTSERPEREVEALRALAEKRVEGVVLCGTRLPDEELEPLVADFPAVVLVNRLLEAERVDEVVLDDEGGMYRLVRWLMAQGYRRFALLAGPPRSYSSQGRRKGMRRALAEAGGDAELVEVIDCAPFIQGGQEAAEQILQAHPESDVLVCYNDLVALGALRACQARGLAVPRDIAVTGFDDIALAELVTPSLTTMRVPKQQLGELAATLLLERLAGRIERRRVVLGPELVVRSSTREWGRVG
ncbi:MAG: LacI family DNA-binding transcriptional regulator [Thermomicrobium sp.]|nr:LacI family DNA-binding transcriptional regulator [Thermomicrobium sp.]